ncbi:hypothetical protein ISN44_As09g010260 [Arabidopsis suecica]|uniref:Uncharacterized protein n=1 Tax=Arabidopsis suecica TaxID=45249 RepID=A0A8T2AGR0_ARASU|nr:hypothetical protein ISN44_As09g010260 [Arabidopsis suecica]
MSLTSQTMVAANSIVTPKPTHEREEDSRRRDQRGVEWSEKIKEEWIPARDPARSSFGAKDLVSLLTLSKDGSLSLCRGMNDEK